MLTVETASQTSSGSQPVSPGPIFETLTRYQHTMALKGAIDLDLFTHIAAGASTPEDIAVRSRASERGVRILCDFLTIIGFLRKADGRYQLSPVSAWFLDKASPNYFGSVAQFVADPAMIARFFDVAALVRRGGAVDDLEKEDVKWVEFARLMTPMVGLAARATAVAVSGSKPGQKVLDIAAGSGIFGLSVAELNPNAEIVALDWETVLEVTRENARRRGLEDRFRTIAGNAFQADLGSGYDLVLIPNFLHHFDPPTNIQLLKRVRASLKPEGRIAVVEFVPNDDRVTPPIAASFSLTMLGHTPRGDAYTFRELNGMFAEAGFGEGRRQDLLPTPLTLILAGV